MYNISLIILGLNVGDYTRRKNESDERIGSSGWTRDKLLYALQQTLRNIVPKKSYVRDVISSLQKIREEALN
jgi:hypothetical protein